VLTTDVPSDIVVEAGGMNFSLHKVRYYHFLARLPSQPYCRLETHGVSGLDDTFKL
jgi:hypothetical protein